jgi:hypothetical protein
LGADPNRGSCPSSVFGSAERARPRLIRVRLAKTSVVRPADPLTLTERRGVRIRQTRPPTGAEDRTGWGPAFAGVTDW